MSSNIDKLIIKDLDKGNEFWSFQKESERDFVHGLFAYPAMMVPKMQREIISIFHSNLNKEILTIYDPFMGSGTILVEGMLQGANIIGVDINPLAYLVSKVKTTIYSITRLQRSTNILIARLQHTATKARITHFDNIEKWFKPEIILELDYIKEQILLEPCRKHRRYFWVAFSETIRSVSNSRTSTYKLHIKTPKSIENFNKSAIEIFIQILKKNLLSTTEFQVRLEESGHISKTKHNCKKYTGNIKLVLGDTMLNTKMLCNKYRPDLIITSPPYGDNHTTVTYGQYSVLSLRWIDLHDIANNIDVSLIDTLSKIDQVSMGGTKKEIENSNVLQASPTLRKNIETVRSIAENKVNKILSFYNDFYIFIENLAVVKSDTYIIMTVGNRSVAKHRIEMDQILVEYFNHMNFDFIHKFNRNILNKRMPTINFTDKVTGEKCETMTKEYVLIFKKR